jgi:GNAT superfamily N-acetyltransferase
MNILLKDTPKTTRVFINQMTTESLAGVTQIHIQAFKDAMNVRLGADYVMALFKEFLGIEDGIAFMATNEGNHILGYIVGGPLGCGQSMNRHLIWVAGKGICLHPSLLLSHQFRVTLKTRVKIMLGKSEEFSLPIDLPQPVMGLMGFAVLPKARGQGIGKCLLEAFEDSARTLRMGSLGLSVYPENANARSVYEQCGWISCERSIRPGQVMHYVRIL